MTEEPPIRLKSERRKKYLIVLFFGSICLILVDIVERYYNNLYALIVVLCAIIFTYIKDFSSWSNSDIWKK